jgi:hypothetical protein
MNLNEAGRQSPVSGSDRHSEMTLDRVNHIAVR